MLRIAPHSLANFVGKLIQVLTDDCLYVGMLKGRGTRIVRTASGRAESTWVLTMRLGDVEFDPEQCVIYSMQYEPLPLACRIR
jgi:hypothetical protein